MKIDNDEHMAHIIPALHCKGGGIPLCSAFCFANTVYAKEKGEEKTVPVARARFFSK